MIRKLLIIILVILVTITIVGNIVSKNYANKLPKVSIDDLLKDADTGDIIVCSSNILQFTPHDNMRFSLSKRLWVTFTKYLQKSYTIWTHVGMIIRDNNELYVLEVVYDDIYKYNYLDGMQCTTGIRLVKLEDKIADYNGICGWLPLHNRNKSHMPNLDYIKTHLLPPLYGKDFSVKLNNVIRTLLFGPDIKNPYEFPTLVKPYIMCSETIYHIYHMIGIVNGRYNPSQIFPNMYVENSIDIKEPFSLGSVKLINLEQS
jgi:hypothetical protein